MHTWKNVFRYEILRKFREKSDEKCKISPYVKNFKNGIF